MNELDEHGWGHIHYAAYRGFIKSIEKFVLASEDQLEFETGDDLHSTPLLLAVMSGNKETIKCLIDLGANVAVINTQNHGVVEICAMKEYISLLEFFIDLNHKKLNVWKNLLHFLSSDSDEEAEVAGRCLRTLTQGGGEATNTNCRCVFDNGGVPTIAKVIKGTINEETKTEAFHILLNIIAETDEVKTQCVSSGILPSLMKFLKSSNEILLRLASQCLKEIVKLPQYAKQAVQNSAVPSLVGVLKGDHTTDVLVEVVDAMALIAQATPTHQDVIGSTTGAISAIVNLFEDCNSKALLMSLTHTASTIVKDHERNQDDFVDKGGAASLVMLTRVKYRDLQLLAVDTIHRLAENNPNTQKAILEEGAVMPLMQMLNKSRAQDVLEKTAGALWALAGDVIDEKRSMATMIGVHLLIEFLSSLVDELHYIGSEGLSVLAQGPHNKQTAIGEAGGVHPLVRLLRSDKEYIVLSVIRTLRYLCLGVGFIPHAKNQETVRQSRGIKFLVALMAHSRNELIQIEAALTLACIGLGNKENLEEIQENSDFSFISILKMVYSADEMVRLLAGLALATFSYNHIQNQKSIAEHGGIKFSCFVPFLKSDDEFYRCNAAFQVVTLARIIPDEEQAVSSAAGIKLLVDLLAESKSNEILALAADCIARLAHTRAGVPAAIVSIEAVDLLCKHLSSTTEQVRGNAAIALGYLSYNHQAERQMLNRFRVDPYLVKVTMYYTQSSKLSPSFMEGWRHYRKVGLPPIEDGRLNLVSQKNAHFTKAPADVRPFTILSLDEAAPSTNLHSSNTNLFANHTEEATSHFAGRFSRSSRRTSQCFSENGGKEETDIDAVVKSQPSVLSSQGSGRTIDVSIEDT